jgi:nitrite reductase/ring-hydroxylating ferredoxin subunit
MSEGAHLRRDPERNAGPAYRGAQKPSAAESAADAPLMRATGGAQSRPLQRQEDLMSRRIDLCSTADVAPGNALKVETGDLTLAVFNLDGEFYVTDDLCTHGPGSLSEGYIEGDIVECNFHNGQFNIKTGEVVSPPCMIPIKTYKTVVENDRVLIETE